MAFLRRYLPRDKVGLDLVGDAGNATEESLLRARLLVDMLGSGIWAIPARNELDDDSPVVREQDVSACPSLLPKTAPDHKASRLTFAPL